MHPLGQLDHDLKAELAPSQHAGDDAVVLVRPAENALGHPHGAAVHEPPDDAPMRQPTSVLRDAFGKDVFGLLGTTDLFLVGDASAARFLGFLGLLFLAPRFLAFLLSPQGEGLGDFRGRARVAEWFLPRGVFLFEFRDFPFAYLDALIGRMQIGECVGERIDPWIEVAGKFAAIRLFLVDSVHANRV